MEFGFKRTVHRLKRLIVLSYTFSRYNNQYQTNLTRSTGQCIPPPRHVSPLCRDTDPDPDPCSGSPLKFNRLICSLAHCQLSMKISCKSVRKFLQPVANRQTTTITYPPWRRNQQWLVRYTVAMIEWGTFKVNCSSIQHEYIASCLSIKPPDLSASVMRGLTYQCERVSSYFHDWRIATRLIP